MKFEELNQGAYNHAIKKLAARDRTTYEIKKHLESKDYKEEDIENIIAYLLEYGYLNHNNYVKEYFRYSLSKKWGPLKIEKNLKEKGLKKEEISKGKEDYQAEADKELKIIYYENGQEIANRELEKYTEEEKKENVEKIIGKIGRKLANLGYETDLIYRIIGDSYLN